MKIWEAATKEIEEAIPAAYPKDNPVYTLVAAGAAGNWIQVRSLAGMKGVVANSKGQQIPRPIRSSFREGLSVLEYFINTHSARKGLADTALRTAESGYLTRRLVDVSQDVIVRESDCGTERGVDLPMADRYADGSLHINEFIETSVQGRVLAVDLVDADGTVVVPRGTDMREQHVEDGGRRRHHQRQGAFGADLRGGHRHLRGLLRPVAGHRQPGRRGRGGRYRRRAVHRRARHPADHADLPHRCGVGVHRTSPRVCRVCRSCSRPGSPRARRRSPTPSAGSGSRTRTSSSRSSSPRTTAREEIVYDKLPKTQRLATITVDGSERLLVDGDTVQVGQQLLEGNPDPHEVLRVMGPRQVQLHLVREVQNVYRSQGVSIHDKHIEVIIRQMLRRVTIIDSGSTEFLPGAVIERKEFEASNRRVLAEGGEPAAGRPALMGITKASLATESWLSAASFQETTRVLTDAAINAKSDRLVGSEGERHHRQADPRRDRHRAVPRHRGAADRRGAGRGVHAAVVRRHLLRRGHLRGLRRGVGAAGRLRPGARLPVGPVLGAGGGSGFGPALRVLPRPRRSASPDGGGAVVWGRRVA